MASLNFSVAQASFRWALDRSKTTGTTTIIFAFHSFASELDPVCGFLEFRRRSSWLGLSPGWDQGHDDHLFLLHCIFTALLFLISIEA